MQINNNIILSRCPLCASNSIHQVGKLGYRENIIFSTREIELIHTPELWRCKQCLSSFVQYALDAETAKLLYSSGKAGERWSSIAFDQHKSSEVVDRMRMIFNGTGSVLDVGCNTGELLDFASEFGCKTSGVEFSSASREILVKKCHSAYATLEESLGHYDIITAFDLIEHLYDVPTFLKICRDKLSKKGKLVILTGNVGSMGAKISGARWWYAQYPEHIVFPSKKYFSKYSGFCIEKWIPTYASKEYKWPIVHIVSWASKNFLKGGYTGLPSFGPDHTLIILRK